MAIIAPGVCRFIIEGEIQGQDCFNILDVEIGDVTGTGDREDAIDFLAGDILNQWSDHILPLITSGYRANRVSWVDLDSADGSTGARSETDGSTWPEDGSGEGSSMPANVCMRIRKNINGSRGRRAGVLRLGGVAEQWTSPTEPNQFQGNVIEILNDAFEELKDGINGEGGDTTIAFESNLVVVHTKDDLYVGHSRITTFQGISRVGSMRRRLPGYGR